MRLVIPLNCPVFWLRVWIWEFMTVLAWGMLKAAFADDLIGPGDMKSPDDDCCVAASNTVGGLRLGSLSKSLGEPMVYPEDGEE